MIIKKDPAEIAAYLEDSSNYPGARADALYIPESEAEIVELARECSRAGRPLTISAGGTNNVASRIPLGGGLLSVERFNRIIGIDRQAKTAELQAGVVIDAFLGELEKQALFYPPFPTERTAFISGNAATNASGEYSYRFGATRRYVRRLRVVLADGEILDLRRGEVKADGAGRLDLGARQVRIPAYTTPGIKCSAGYYSRPGMDAVDLFVGSEGTLGIFSEVGVQAIDALPARTILLLFFPGGRDPLAAREKLRARPDLVLYSLEYFDRHSLDFLVPDFPLIPADADFAVYVETEEAQLEQWLDLVEELGALDSWASQDQASYRKLIGFRHRLPENINRYFKQLGTKKVSLDFAVPEARFQELYEYYRDSRAANRELETVLFGHLGENHLHFNYFPRDDREKARVFELYDHAARRVIALGGTIAAEHGIGKMKHRYLEMMYGAAGLREMARVKLALDPAGILGRDNIFPAALLG